MDFEKLLELLGEVSDEVKEELKNALDAQYEKGKSDQIAEQEKNSLADLVVSGLRKAGAYNEEIALGLMDMDKIILENDEVSGLDEEIGRIKNEYSFLFRQEGPQFCGDVTKDGDVDISSLNYLERLKLYRENPELYKLHMNK